MFTCPRLSVTEQLQRPQVHTPKLTDWHREYSYATYAGIAGSIQGIRERNQDESSGFDELSRWCWSIGVLEEPDIREIRINKFLPSTNFAAHYHWTSLTQQFTRYVLRTCLYKYNYTRIVSSEETGTKRPVEVVIKGSLF